MSPAFESDDRLLTSRVNDAKRIARDKYVHKFIGFLDERSAALCLQALGKHSGVAYTFFGGYDDAQRVMLGIFPDEEAMSRMSSAWPITALTLRFREVARLTHRDVLGSLMSLGITRESVGDILIDEGRAVIFVADSVAEFVRSQLSKVGGEGVKVEEGFSQPLPAAYRLLPVTETVASMRLDGVVAALCGTSRTRASEWIQGGLVAVNGIECDRVSAALRDGDKLSVRGIGKFRIDNCEDTTRKGRIVLKAQKYI